MKEIQTIWDGDTYPVLQFQLKSGGAIRDLSNHALWFDVWKDGQFLVRRPGTVLSPKADGVVECFLRGSETDWGGSGARLVVYPTLLVPITRQGASADNILSNPSFDTFGGSSPTQLATSWSIVGTQANSTYTVGTSGPKPAAIHGSYQSIVRSSGGGTDQLRQVVTAHTAQAGEVVTFGVWARGEGITGSQNNSNAIRLIFGSPVDNVTTQLPVGSFDWTFITVSRTVTLAQTTIDSRITTTGNTGTWQFDDACTFLGRYRIYPAEPRRVLVRSRLRIPKTSNQISGWGSFEQDSNGDGLPDGWMKSSLGFTPTISREQAPANVHDGTASLKVVCNGGSDSPHIKTAIRGKFLAGETWRADLAVKTSGTLTGTAPSIELRTERFDKGQETSTPTAMGQTLAQFTHHSTDLTLTKDTNLLEFRVNFADASGTLWLDQAELYRI